MVFGSRTEISESTYYDSFLRDALDKIHQSARENLDINSERMRMNYDLSIHGDELNEKDLVLLYNSQRKKGVSPKL
uniref:Uncharacterized protein n=1 Tax=Megaselia scalaris TaxID=36166 RepID=T1GVP9_MEGSC